MHRLLFGAEMGYALVLEKIYAYSKFGSVLGLERVRKVASALGNPQKGFECIIVGGTNGKGSTVRMLGSILKECGFSVGEYYSPQVLDFRERFLVNGKMAGKEEIVRAFEKVERAAKIAGGRRAFERVSKNAGVQLTFFELLTLMAFEIFKRRKVHFAILEVGLGGRGDAVNICEPVVSAITSIGLEHTEILGNTIAKIAHEKCAIGRKGKFLVCGRMDAKTRVVVGKECKKIGTKPIFFGKDFFASNVRDGRNGAKFLLNAMKRKICIKTAMRGEFQVSNASVAAVCAILAADAQEKGIKRGIFDAKLPARMERRGNLLFDCAHNVPAIRELVKEIKRTRKRGQKIVWVFGAMRDKNIKSMLAEVATIADEIVLTQVDLGRCATVVELEREAKGFFTPSAIYNSLDAQSALAAGKGRAGASGLVVIAGSMYVLAAVRGRKPGVSM
ncbi:UDP-N-acetylmuramoyl-L-alanyl-D-glutamate--2,6-diaminopimelate ligase [Candidatus Anstonella stagnisolia]|nr:UDP-N-acetylmuramoyl-L-alanyl-D-glutamate--2,6-diaminopimelate ligase [Candidatus Anstonella stagnisolia]